MKGLLLAERAILCFVNRKIVKVGTRKWRSWDGGGVGTVAELGQ
uniref:Uncharacterized protein n=1 Tax=Romanomermis culicivorax TaxID=13658 RepID=A0A915IPY7_ROMCU